MKRALSQKAMKQVKFIMKIKIWSIYKLINYIFFFLTRYYTNNKNKLYVHIV